MPDNNASQPNPVPPNSVPPKPMNPEMEAVSANQPKAVSPAPSSAQAASTPTSQATSPQAVGASKGSAAPPQKIGKEQSTKSRQRFLVGCFGGFIFLFILFIVLMVLMVGNSGASNPVMQAFGLDPAGIRTFLQGVVGFTFGLISILFLVLAVVGLFRFLGTQKSDKEARKRHGRRIIFSSIFLFIVIFLWVLLATYIARLEIQADRVVAEILVMEPEDLSNLEAPVQIRYSALNVARGLSQSGVQIEAMNWDLNGDGQFETPVGGDPEVTHLYNRKGTYIVGLQVKVAGEPSYRPAYTKTIVIPNAVFIANPSTGTAPLLVEFDASDIVSKENTASVDWDFDGDGRFELEGPNNLTPRHTFNQIGTYNVHLRVVDKNNNVQNYRRNIEIVPSNSALLSAEIEATPGLEGPQPLQVNFSGEPSKSLKGSITKYEWNFGDGSKVESGKNVSKIFEKPGFYTVTLKVEDTIGNRAESTVEVEVQQAASVPQPVITTDPVFTGEGPLEGTLPFKVSFSAAKSQDPDNDIIDYEWDFDGDGKTDETGEKVEYTFENEGEFTVGLRVRDSEDHEASTTLLVRVQNPGVQAKISATPEEGTAPLIVQFDGSASSTYQGNIVSYEWDFGDGSAKTITGAAVSHKYASVGTYEAKLKVLTNTNMSDTATMTIFVREIPLKACFTPSRTNGLAPLTVTFNSKCSTGNVAKYAWQFGDGGESSSANPTYTFENPGSYNVNLEITDSKNNVNTYQAIIVAEGELK